MNNPISESDRKQLDSTPVDRLPAPLGDIAKCLSRVVVRRATQPGHRVGSFLQDLADAGLKIVPLEAPAKPAASKAPTGTPPRQTKKAPTVVVADPFKPPARRKKSGVPA